MVYLFEGGSDFTLTGHFFLFLFFKFDSMSGMLAALEYLSSDRSIQIVRIKGKNITML